MKQEKHITLANELESLIEKGSIANGEKLPTQQEICDQYLVSRSCVHNALNLLENRNLILRVPGKGIYASSPQVQKRQLRNVGVIMPDFQYYTYTESDNYGLDIFWGIERELRERKLGCQLHCHALNDLETLGNLIRNMPVDAILLDHRFAGQEWNRQKVHTGLPTVFAGFPTPAGDCGSVEMDYFTSLQYLFSRLVMLGKKTADIYSPNDFKTTHQLIAFIAAARTMFPEIKIRFVDFMDGRPHNPADDPHIRAKVRSSIQDGTLPDVFIGHTDWSAHWICEELKANGIPVPERCEVVGFLGLGVSRTSGISTFAVDAAEIGRASVALLAEMIDAEDYSIIRKLPFQYTERNTLKIKQKLN